MSRVQFPVEGLGPGRRVGLWVQGCSLACEGCVSPSMWSPRGGTELDVRQLGAILARAARAYDGLTVSGGEPFEQYAAIVTLAALFKRLTGSTVVVYTGFRLEELVAAHPERSFLHFVDWLVDGRFEAARAEGDGWRGSSNQRLWRVERGEARLESTGFERGRWSVALPPRGPAHLAGVPAPGDLEAVASELAALGVSARFC